jgi:hypothetical protein
MPSFDMFSSSKEATLTINSTPPGAEARASTGGVCRTPCSLQVPSTGDLTVTYSLDGYAPQTISVKAIAAEKTALIDMSSARFEPNPVVAELKAAPPPAPPPRRQRQ